MELIGRWKEVATSREGLALFGAVVGFYAVANLALGSHGRPLEPYAEALFAGHWALRTDFLIGGFMMQLTLDMLWFTVYAYALAVGIVAVCRAIYRFVPRRRD